MELLECTYCKTQLLYQYKLSKTEELYQCPECKREFMYDAEDNYFSELED
jgi:DNA-directed RNA polymerase subunit RPC12/RpoP